ncbi:MAG TPA: PRC-barrel domain-containing protein [candidate division Zixibacteria bacterium]|nr:PRC-barrel domain-containing protein [candidate division Zixibacteria bacterium]
MSTSVSRELERLSSSGMTLADPAMDLRQREVRDRHGEAVGTVTDLLIDPETAQLRLVEVTTAGGLLGIGRKRHLVPVEAITADDPRTVSIDRPRQEIESTPEYVPAEGDDEENQYAAAYEAYGVEPYWVREAAVPGGIEARPGSGRH